MVLILLVLTWPVAVLAESKSLDLSDKSKDLDSIITATKSKDLDSVVTTTMTALFDLPLTRSTIIPAPPLVWPMQAGGSLAIEQSITTSSVEQTTVSNGDMITYTLTVVNKSANLVQVELTDILPRNVLAGLYCEPTCEQIVTTRQIIDPITDLPKLVTVTERLKWQFSVTAGESNKVIFGGRVRCQSDGQTLLNRALVRDVSDSANVATSELNLAVKLRLNSPGVATLSNSPTWCSDDLGGTLNMDWGDFDNDGDLDLLLASTDGVRVYRNNAEHRLELLWEKLDYTLDARWADLVDADTYLEIAAVGASVNNSPLTEGTNSIYRYDATALDGQNNFTLVNIFTSTHQLFQLAPADYNHDGHVDLVVSALATNVSCPLRFYRNSGNGKFVGPGECVSTQGAAKMSPADYNNDGWLDLAVSVFPNTVRVLLNNKQGVTATVPLSQTQASVSVEEGAELVAHDLAWGDFDGDGWLDLAAAFPGLTSEARVYRNRQGQGFDPPIRVKTTQLNSPAAVDWGDFTGDGRLDLLVGDAPPKIYRYNEANQKFEYAAQLDGVSSNIRSMRALDQDNDGDLDVAVSDLNGPSLIFTNFGPMLSVDLTPIKYEADPLNLRPFKANSVAWGDVNGDGALDLLYGAGEGELGSRLYLNSRGSFPVVRAYENSFGSHSEALGDVNGNGALDIVLGAPSRLELYLDNQLALADWPQGVSSRTNSVAWGDADEDSNGLLDLLVGSVDNGLTFYKNETVLSGTVALQPTWTDNFPTTSVAWADYDLDGYLDFAAGSSKQGNRVYRNNGNGTFSYIWSSPRFSTTAVAWGDIDGDGDLDLALANDGFSFVYKNETCENPAIHCHQPRPYRNHSLMTFSRKPVWISPISQHSVSVAWGDWDNDGDLDLALGNNGTPNEVYANVQGELKLMWRAATAYKTTAVAWGDQDGDGDLDLAISVADGDKPNGIYRNNYVRPAHLNSDFVQAMSLAQNPSYLQIEPPGNTQEANFYASAEILPNFKQPIAINYRLFDPDGTRQNLDFDVMGDKVIAASYQFSLDDGGSWRTATPYPPIIPPDSGGTEGGRYLQASRQGQRHTFLWQATTDQAISDNVRFRICLIPQNRIGRTQRAVTCAVSAPFRVRATTCIWPDKPTVKVNGLLIPEGGTAYVKPKTAAVFDGSVTVGGGDTFKFSWNLGETQVVGSRVQYSYPLSSVYTIVMTTTSPACPVSKIISTQRRLVVGSGLGVYLPMIVRSR